MVKSNNNASLSKKLRNAVSLRLQNIESPATKVFRKKAKFLLLITLFRSGPEKCTLLQIYLEYNTTSHKKRMSPPLKRCGGHLINKLHLK
jgi:hypothetical protein